MPRTDAWHDDGGHGDYVFMCVFPPHVEPALMLVRECVVLTDEPQVVTVKGTRPT